jgi:hypothetical protein
MLHVQLTVLQFLCDPSKMLKLMEFLQPSSKK